MAREPRLSEEPVIHHGLIASGDQVMRHGATRDRLRKERRIEVLLKSLLTIKGSVAIVALKGRCMYRRVFHVLLERSFAIERSVAGVAFEYGRVRRRVQMLLESLLAYERSATVVALERRVVALERRRQYNNNGSCYLSRLRPSDWESRALSRVATD